MSRFLQGCWLLVAPMILVHDSWVSDIAFDESGALLATSSSDQGRDPTVRVWDVNTRKTRLTIQPPTDGGILDVHISSRGGFIMGSNRSKDIVQIWDLMSGASRFLWRAPDDISCATVSDRQLLAAGLYDGAGVRFWDRFSANRVRELHGHTGTVYAVAFSPDNSTLASASADGTIKLWLTKTSKLVATLSGHTKSVIGLDFSPKGDFLVSGGRDRQIIVWNLKSREIVARRRAVHALGVKGVRYSPTGSHIVSVGLFANYPDHLVDCKLWTAPMLESKAVLKDYQIDPDAVVFSPDGALLAAAHSDQTIRIWNVTTGKEENVLKGHNGHIDCVEFSPNGEVLASGARDNTVRLWQVNDLRRRRGPKPAASALD